MTTTYHCPISGAAFAVEPEMIDWDENGNAVVNCDDLPSHEITIAYMLRAEVLAILEPKP